MLRYLFTALGAAIIMASSIAKAATPLVDVNWVVANHGKPGVIILDVRGKLGGPIKATFLRGHIPGAVWSNYLKDGWRIKDKNGTVGQMPPVEKLEKLIGGLGIGNSDHVVVVPVGGKALDVGTATRVYWTFKILGHDKVSILNGGMKAYLSKKTQRPRSQLTRLRKVFQCRKLRLLRQRSVPKCLPAKRKFKRRHHQEVSLWITVHITSF